MPVVTAANSVHYREDGANRARGTHRPQGPVTVCSNAIREAHLPGRGRGYSLAIAAYTRRPAFLGCRSFVVGWAVAATFVLTAEDGLSEFHGRNPELPIARDLVKELRHIAGYAKLTLTVVVSPSWAAQALDRESAKRGAGPPLVETGTMCGRNFLSTEGQATSRRLEKEDTMGAPTMEGKRTGPSSSTQKSPAQLGETSRGSLARRTGG